jgi:hypothetical protein
VLARRPARFDASPARLKGLIRPALKQDAAVVLVCDSNPDSLPDEVEVQPTSVLNEVVDWADYLAFDVARERLHEMKDRLKLNPLTRLSSIPPNPVGAWECGVCAVTLKSAWKLACKDGPVFDWREIALSQRERVG